jgi:hypothetical protein
MGVTEEVSRIVAFVSLGALTTTQQIAGSVLSNVPGADADVVAEETLVLVSVATSRSAEVGLRARLELIGPVVAAIAEIPFLYHDYLLGAYLLANSSRVGAADESAFIRMHRMHEFYRAHIPQGVYPGERALADKLELWMGRVSPRRTGVHPSERLNSVGASAQLAAHAKVVLAYCRRAAGSP